VRPLGSTLRARLNIDVGHRSISEIGLAAVYGHRRAQREARNPQLLRAYGNTIGSISVGSLFLTFPTRALTGQQIMSSEG
jgi:hypothetical protein